MDVRPADLADPVGTKTELGDYPRASTVGQNVLVYDGGRLRRDLADPVSRLEIGLGAWSARRRS